jgi:hypothetical protein
MEIVDEWRQNGFEFRGNPPADSKHEAETIAFDISELT